MALPAAALLLAALVTPVNAAAVSIQVQDNKFDPAVTPASVGQTVVWASAASTNDLHNVREDHKIFYSGRPYEIDFTFKRVFSAGTFGYFCERHGFRGGGMDGTVRVPVKLARAGAGDVTVVWATDASNTGTKFTVQYRIGSGSWRPWKSAVSARKATFPGKPGTRYAFRAKSLKGTAASAWSPVASITS
ncbi:MAG TPA: hypothetical protein VG929_02695 [Actinomycetota bacterium]|nr:hypothetical protein [Actinomycetota bacterium]